MAAVRDNGLCRFVVDEISREFYFGVLKKKKGKKKEKTHERSRLDLIIF